MKAFSEEWAKSVCEKINSNSDYKSAALDINWNLILSMNDGNIDCRVFIDLKDGTCANARIASESDIESAEFIISASKDSWQKILSNNLDPMMAVMTKKLELKKGNVGSLVKNVDAAKELIKSASKVDTEF